MKSDKRKKLYNKYLNCQFTFSDAIKMGLTRHEFNTLLKINEIIRIYYNVYVFAQGDISEESIFKSVLTYLGKPSIICMLSALSYYDLTDIIPKKTWVLVPANKQSRRKDIRLVRLKNPCWNVGIISEEDFKITSLDRTIVESLVYEKRVGLQTATFALRKALDKKKTSLLKIYDMAKKMNVEKKIEKYIKVLM